MKHIKRLSSNNSSIQSSTSITRGSNKSSPVARASSIFSIGSDLSESSIYNSSSSDENLSNDTKLLIKNEDLRLEETLERVALLKKFKRVAPAQPSVIASPSASLSQQLQKPITPITSPTKSEYLTPTRQTNLPPKDHYESTRHMHDYSNLLDTQISKEQHDLKKHKAQQEKADKQHAKDLKTWNDDVLPHFNKAISQPSTRELWWRGVPESIRQEVWMKQCCILPNEENSKKSKLGTILDECLDTSRGIIEDACAYKLMGSELEKLEFSKVCGSQRMELIKFVQVISDRIQFSFPNLKIFQIGYVFEEILLCCLTFELVLTEIQKTDISTRYTGFKCWDVTLRLVNLTCVLYSNLNDAKLTVNALVGLTGRKLINRLLGADEGIIFEKLSDQLAYFKKNSKISQKYHQETDPSKKFKDSSLNRVDGHDSKQDKPLPLTPEEKLQKRDIETATYLEDIDTQFAKFLVSTSPSLYNNFIKQDISTIRILQLLTPSIFSNILQFDVVERIIDVYLFEGDMFLLRCSLALLKKCSWKLFGDLTEVYVALSGVEAGFKVDQETKKHNCGCEEVIGGHVTHHRCLKKFVTVGGCMSDPVVPPPKSPLLNSQSARLSTTTELTTHQSNSDLNSTGYPETPSNLKESNLINSTDRKGSTGSSTITSLNTVISLTGHGPSPSLNSVHGNIFKSGSNVINGSSSTDLAHRRAKSLPHISTIDNSNISNNYKNNNHNNHNNNVFNNSNDYSNGNESKDYLLPQQSPFQRRHRGKTISGGSSDELKNAFYKSSNKNSTYSGISFSVGHNNNNNNNSSSNSTILGRSNSTVNLMNGASSTSISSYNGGLVNGHSRHYRANCGSSTSIGSIDKRDEFDEREDITVVEEDENMNDNESNCSSDTGSVIHHRLKDENDNVNGSGSSINLSNGKSISITLNGSGIDPGKPYSMFTNHNHGNGVRHPSRSRSRSDVGLDTAGSGSSASSFANLHSNNTILNGNGGN
ncbi:unnamed protein product [Ambrosiozyma monospora]|uniref:Unnamed protein product n=1 Tax=Ambrosiozyma monospora TaxID=43982 RepID=A0A9W6YYL5_AMBMO|nr:unnamed protein product [Ambrosiozyma monospora]